MSVPSNSPIENQSEVARLRALISAEYESAQRALHGFSEGTARHAFITTKYSNVGLYVEQLSSLIGKNEALGTYFKIQDETEDRLQEEKAKNVSIGENTLPEREGLHHDYLADI